MGGSIMGTDTKTPAPQLWPSFSLSDLACGRWTLPSPPLCVCLCSLPSTDLCFLTGTFPAQITPLIFHGAIPTLICGIPFPLGLYSSFSTSVRLHEASCMEMMRLAWRCHAGHGGDEQMVVICRYSARAIFNHLHSCNAVILVQHSWKLTSKKQRMKGYGFLKYW